MARRRRQANGLLAQSASSSVRECLARYSRLACRRRCCCILLRPIGVAGGDEGAEERMRLERLGFELGVKLAAEEEGMLGQLDDLDIGRVRRSASDAQTGAGEQRLVFAIEFVTGAMAFGNFGAAVGLCGFRPGFEEAGPRAKAHSAAHFFDACEFAELVDDAVRRGGIEL